MYQQYRPRSFNFLPTAVKNLLIINGLFFLATYVMADAFRVDLTKLFGLHYWTSPDFRIYQVITHMFMHGGLGHIFSNMLALWMFGTSLENLWGPKKFIIFYIFTALGAALLHQTVLGIEFYNINQNILELKQNPTVDNLVDAYKAVGQTLNTTIVTELKSIYSNGVIAEGELNEALRQLEAVKQARLSIPTVGASGAVFGVLIAFAMYFPNTEIIMLLVPFPIKAKYFVGIYGIMELFLGVQNNPGDSVAHFAHLGGLLFGFILVKYWNRTNRRTLY
jgi:membrane associated rhomboid family serine protease